jgi:hypothetical protein
MTIEFSMTGVAVGPRVLMSTRGGIEVLEVLGYAWRGRGTTGDTLEAVNVVKRCDVYLKSQSRRVVQVALAKFELRQGGSANGAASHVDAVLVDMAELRIFAQKAVHAGRDIQWIP